MKKICSLALIVTLLAFSLSLYGCHKTITEEEAIGAWLSSKAVYLETYDCKCERALIINENGIYVENLKRADTHKAIDGTLEMGTWRIDEDGNLCLQAYGSLSYATYEFNGKTLKNGKWVLKKQGD